MSKKKLDAAQTKTEVKFTKRALVSCKKLREQRDIVSALLEDDKVYTISEVERMIEQFLKGKVN